MLRIKYVFLFLLIAACSFTTGAFYFQYIEGIAPCPLCIFQRLFVMLLIPLSLIPFLINFRSVGYRVFAALILMNSIIGASISARHIWLQFLPKEQVPSCGPDVEYLFRHFPWTEAFRMILHGSGECATITWQFGLTMPGWVLVFFSTSALVSVYILLKGR